MKNEEMKNTASQEKNKEKKKRSATTAIRRGRRKKTEAASSEKPNFTARKKLFKKEAFVHSMTCFARADLV